MTVEIDLYNALSDSTTLTGIVGDRIYANRAPDNVIRPYAVYSVISKVPQNDLSDDPVVDKVRVQVDCYSEASYTQAKNMAAACRAALKSQGYCTFERDDYESDEKLHRVQLDFSIFG